ncbi:hypothetical protein ACHAWT_000820 [Skeletonema menzelii]|mmetsp:Transcript_6960/g.11365  ORF Transcript_6960/g.11365 Transcript_6960/m.11365 type:complete len:263 (+) Transcript_6960:132-920(+)
MNYFLFSSISLILAVIQFSSVDSFADFQFGNTQARIPRHCLQQQPQSDNYYGSADSSFIIREFSIYDQLEDIVNLASKPLPDRPEGIVVIAKYTSSSNPDCRATEASYERLARDNPATLFLRCFQEAENAQSLFNRAAVEVVPTYDVFYQNNRVARVDGQRLSDLENVINQYQFMNSDLDLFSEESTVRSPMGTAQPTPWGDGTGSDSASYTKTPRTTASFIPGYDWNKKGGFFDELATDMQKKSGFDFEESYENDWMPKID